jgi:hypothetical protein
MTLDDFLLEFSIKRCAMRYDKFGIWIFVSLIIFLIPIVCLLPRTMAETSATLTFIYSGGEQGQLGIHGCGTEQVGGLSRRQTVIHSLREQYADTLNLHTGTLTDPTVQITNSSTRSP